MRSAPPPGPKRFYEVAATEPFEGGYAVTLDGRKAKTPGRAVLAGPVALAEAMAAEWAGQGETLDMNAMPLTRLQGRYLDTRGDEAVWVRTVLRYAGSDLLCYRGDDPALARRQAQVWQPYLDEVGAAIGAAFAVTEGVMAVEQPEAVTGGVSALLTSLPPAHRYAARLMTELTGSAVLALSVLRGAGPDAGFAASRLDEAFQAERWGHDAEAVAREAALKADWDAMVRFAALTR